MEDNKKCVAVAVAVAVTVTVAVAFVGMEMARLFGRQVVVVDESMNTNEGKERWTIIGWVDYHEGSSEELVSVQLHLHVFGLYSVCYITYIIFCGFLSKS